MHRAIAVQEDRDRDPFDGGKPGEAFERELFERRVGDDDLPLDSMLFLELPNAALRDELYVSVEGVAGGSVEIRRYDADTDPAERNIIATIDDRLCRFLTAGDVDGDGDKEIVVATNKKGLWLLRPESGKRWSKELIASDSSGFEHAAVLLDLDGNGRDELYVASDDQKDVRRYRLTDDGSWEREVLWKHEDELSRFTWNLMPVPIELVPGN